MRDDVFAVHSLDTHPKPDTAEHEFRWEADPQHSEPNPDAETERHGLTMSPNTRPIGNLSHLILAGLVAVAIIGVFFGASFHLLAPRATEKHAEASADNRIPSLAAGEVLRANTEAPPGSQGLPMSKSSERAAPPGFPAAQFAAVVDVPSTKQQEAFLAPIKEPSLQTAPVSSTASSPAQPTPSVGLPSVPPSAAISSGTVKHQLPQSRISHAARSASRHSHSQSAHAAASVTHRARQTRSFDQLVTQLTGQAEPGGATLTPPRTQEPDPFASRRAAQ
jgi:hypothetical protein